MAALAMSGSPKRGGHSSMARLDVMIVEPLALPDDLVEVDGLVVA